MVSALPVLGFVVNGGAVNLHLPGGQIPLEIRHVVHGVPETELHIREDGKAFGLFSGVCESQAAHLAALAYRYEGGEHSAEAVFRPFKDGVAHAMAAAVVVQLRFGGHPSRIPDGIAVLYVIVMSAAVQRNAVVPVSGNAEQAGVPAEAVAAAGVGDQRKEILRSQIINPRKGRPGRGNYIFFFLIIKISIFHKRKPP